MLFIFLLLLLFLSQFCFLSVPLACPFIIAAIKAGLMDMKAQSIGQEREIREGWVTIFLLLDKHVMPRSVSGDTTDWCLSFISPALIWQSSCFIIISAEKIHITSSSLCSVPTCCAEYAFREMWQETSKVRVESSSMDNTFNNTN